MKPHIRKILVSLLLVLCLISTAKVLTQWMAAEEGDDSYAGAVAIAQSATLATTVPAETEPVTEATEAPTESPEPVWIPAPVEEEDPNFATLSSIDLHALREVNPDVVGWIFLPNSMINYPLMQGDDNQFYLEHTWEGNENPYGSIFLETRNNPDLTDFNTIIYGHNMLNGSMFAGLSYFAYQWHWDWNRYVYIVTDDGILRYEVFSSYAADVDSATYGLSFQQPETRENFIRLALENSEIATAITPASTDRIITLSTCTGLGYESRRVVHAVLKMIPDQ